MRWRLSYKGLETIDILGYHNMVFCHVLFQALNESLSVKESQIVPWWHSEQSTSLSDMAEQRRYTRALVYSNMEYLHTLTFR